MSNAVKKAIEEIEININRSLSIEQRVRIDFHILNLLRVKDRVVTSRRFYVGKRVHCRSSPRAHSNGLATFRDWRRRGWPAGDYRGIITSLHCIHVTSV